MIRRGPNFGERENMWKLEEKRQSNGNYAHFR